jgi:CBS domain-containing protein
MKIADILKNKGSAVETVGPTTTVAALLAVLSDRNIGAVVVIGPPGVVGIVSERDVVRRLHNHGAEVLTMTVGEIMTSKVVVCKPEDHADELAQTMTARRIRHMPVCEGSELVGIVSIGDVVKSRIEELEEDREHLEAYIQQG